MRLASFLGSTLFLVLLGIAVFGIFYYVKRRRAAILFFIATIGATVLLVSLKLVFSPRPPRTFFQIRFCQIRLVSQAVIRSRRFAFILF